MTISQYLVSFIATLNHPFNRDRKLRTILRIMYWKLNQWLFHLPAVVEIENGVKCICYPESSYGGMVVYNRWAEYDVIKKIVELLTPKSTYIDVGANIGDTTIIAAAYTRGKIYAFEPSPVAYPRLLENIRLNGLGDQISAEKYAVSDTDGIISFTETRASETSHIGTGEGKLLKVKSRTLDSYAEEKNIRMIHLLKIDVEGFEVLVLKGAESLLSQHRIKHIIMELNANGRSHGYSNSDVVKFLKDFGYRIQNLPENIDERIMNIHAFISE